MDVNIDNIIVQYSLNRNIKYTVEKVNPNRLLCPERLDIAAKYLYIKLKDNCKEYAEKIYVEHIRAMTKGSFVEPYSKKKDISSFLSAFEKLYSDMKEIGYAGNMSPIPVDKNYRIMDGAHRVAVALVLNIDVPIVKLDMEASYDVYNQSYFENFGTDHDILDRIVLEYLKLKEKCVCINIWPSAVGHDTELFEMIEKYFSIIYKKDIVLNENGAFFYLAQIYKEYSWAQNHQDGFSGVYRKLIPCFPTFSPIRTIFVEVDDSLQLITIKDKMRSLYGLGKHSLHMTDNIEETIEMAEILLSNNTIYFMNKCNALFFNNTFKLLEEAKKIQNSSEQVVFTGSIVLALYGIREAQDIDYISDNDTDMNSHNRFLNWYGVNKNDVLFNTEYQFTFFGMKFLKLQIIRNFKKNRNEGKDIDDIKLIDLVQEDKGKDFRAALLRKKRRIIASIQGFIIKLAHKLGIYEFLRKIYKKIKG